MTITIIIPTYNPIEGWETRFFERYLDFCKSITNYNIPIVLVNDGSSTNLTQGVSFLKERLGENFHYVSYSTNRGKGGALKVGVNHVESEFYLFTDIDFPYTTKSMIDVYQSVLTSDGVVAGYRSQNYYKKVSLYRTVLSKVLRALNNMILQLPTNDTQCGLKAFTNEGKQVLLSCETERFLIDLEFLLAVNKMKMPIKTVPVVLRSDVEFSKFNFAIILNELFSFIKLIWKYRIKKG